jgi:hypothetical protein
MVALPPQRPATPCNAFAFSPCLFPFFLLFLLLLFLLFLLWWVLHSSLSPSLSSRTVCVLLTHLVPTRFTVHHGNLHGADPIGSVGLEFCACVSALLHPPRHFYTNVAGACCSRGERSMAIVVTKLAHWVLTA